MRKSFRVSRKSIGGDGACRRTIYSLIYYFSCGPITTSHPPSHPRPDTRETFPEDSPWDRCPFPPRSCAPGGVATVTQRSEGGWSSGGKQTDRHGGIGKLTKLRRRRRELAGLVNDNTSFARRRSSTLPRWNWKRRQWRVLCHGFAKHVHALRNRLALSFGMEKFHIGSAFQANESLEETFKKKCGHSISTRRGERSNIVERWRAHTQWCECPNWIPLIDSSVEFAC